MKKRLLSLLVSVMCVTMLVGCGSSSDVNTLRKLQSVDTEANVRIVSLSATDKENLIYSQVSDRTLLDLSSLESPTSEEVEAVKMYMDSVDAQLCGVLDSDNGVIDECFTNYLLFEFEKTPYYWQRGSMSILGVDASSRSIVLDVVYNTIGFPKTVKGDSTIVRGEPNYSTKAEVRLERYLRILEAKYRNNSFDDWESDLAEFESIYGRVDDILEEQQNMSLTDTVFTYGNQLTYSGLVNNEIESSSSATMTVRYVLTPKYSLGINLGLDCSHMYVVSYTLNSSEVNNEAYLSQVYNDETGITDEVCDLLKRYYICIDDENFSGLYSLTRNFNTLDKYFADYFNTTYHKYEEFTVTLHSVQGTRIECTAQVSRKVRARGSQMSLPIYTDTYYYVLSLDDGVLKVEEEILLSTKLEGEPAITTTDADISGFSTTISLSAQDKIDMENLIANFGVLQLKKDVTSADFSSVVDTSISGSQLSSLKENMFNIEGVQKVTWITSYLQGYESYASIRCKELVQKEDGTIYDCVVTYDFIKKGGVWYICGYTVNSKNKLDSTTLSTKNCLCIVTPEGIDVMDSKVYVSGDSVSSNDVVVGVTIEYDSYEPTIKDTSNLGSIEGEDEGSKSDLISKLMSVSDAMTKEDWIDYLELNPDSYSILSSAMYDYERCLEDDSYVFSVYLGDLIGTGCTEWLSDFEAKVAELEN